MNLPNGKRLVIVGGVAAGASWAARARRLDESAQITLSSVNIPLGALRQRLGELDHSRPVVTVCALGKSAYFAARILAPNGFQVSTLTGGIRAHFDPRTPAKLPTP